MNNDEYTELGKLANELICITTEVIETIWAWNLVKLTNIIRKCSPSLMMKTGISMILSHGDEKLVNKTNIWYIKTVCDVK